MSSPGYCSACGTPRVPGAAYCTRCGSPLSLLPAGTPGVPGSYAPPPLFLRRADAETILSGLFRTWWGNLRDYFGVYLVLNLILAAVSLVFGLLLLNYVVAGGLGWFPVGVSLPVPTAGEAALYLLAVLLATVVLTAVVAGGMAEYSVRRFRGEAMRVGDALRRGVARFPSILGATLLVYLIVGGLLVPPILLTFRLALRGPAFAFLPLFFVGLMVALVLAVYLGLALCLFAPAIMMENTTAIGGLERSWHLTKGHRLSLFGAVLVVGIVSSAIEEGMAIPGSLVGAGLLPVILVTLANAITASWLVILSAVAYDLIARPDPTAPVGGVPASVGPLPHGVFGSPASPPYGPFSPPGT